MKCKFIILCAVLCFFCTSCNFGEEKNKIQKEEMSDIINISVVKADSFCPYKEEFSSTCEMLSLIYEPLFSYDENFTAVPVLAKSFLVAEDGMSVTVDLKDDVMWHNGENFSADDVLYTVGVILSGDENYYKDKILSAEKINNYCVKINFTRPFLNAEEKLTFPIINQIPKIGTGAYRFLEKVSADTYILERFKGDGTIKKIRVISSPSEESVKRLFEIGETDILLPSSVKYETFNRNSSVKVYDYPTNSLIYLSINKNSFQTFSESTRQAFLYVIEKSNISEKIFYGRATPADFPINPKSLVYPKEKEYKKNTKTAEELLKRDGFIRKDGMFLKVKDGEEQWLSVRLLAEDTKKNRLICESIKKSFQEFGISCEYQIKSYDEYIKASASLEYDLLLSEKELNSASDFLNLEDAGEEFYHIVKEQNIEVLRAYYKRCADMILKNPYIIPICFKDTALLASNNVTGDIVPVINNPFYTIDKWNITR